MLERRQLAPTTTFADMLPAYQHRSCGALCPSGSWYQLILLGGQRHVHVNMMITLLFCCKVVKQLAKVICQRPHRIVYLSLWGMRTFVCPHLIQCFLGHQDSPLQTGRRSVQPFLHICSRVRLINRCWDHRLQ